MRKYLNSANIPLSVAVFLATDNYDHDPDTISATALLKPIRQLVLASRVPESQSMVDISTLFKSRMGSALHDAIERSWTENHSQAMKALGYPAGVIKRVKINPDPATVTEDDIPVYLEQRAYREVMGRTISGKYDFVAEGRVEDFKSTSVFMFTKGTKDEDYKLQGSIYRWLNPNIITQSEMAINFLLTDFQAARAANDPTYPNSSTPQKIIPLLSVGETQAFVEHKIALIDRYKDTPEEDLPLCTDKELWRSEPQYKYYKNPDKMARSTKNFDHKQDAYARLAKDGGVGVVIEKPGEVTACKFCPAFPICSQKDDLIADGSLKL